MKRRMKENLKQIRKAKKSELDEIVLLANKTFEASYRSFLGDHNVDWYINNSELKKELVVHFDDLHVLTLDEKIVGYIIYFDNFIHIMMIDSSEHNAGLGSYLLNEVEERIFKSYDSVKLQSFVGNQVATNFYLKNGWTKGKVNNANKDVAMVYFEKQKA